MSTTSKSPRRVLLVVWEVGRMALRDYAHRFSPKKFTQPQLLACLVLKEFLRLDYRKLAALLRDAPDLAQAIGLECVPHFTTFQKSRPNACCDRAVRGAILAATLRMASHPGKLRGWIRLAALDGSGWESRHASGFYVRRRAKGGESLLKTWYRRFPKAGLACDTQTHLTPGPVPGCGPGPDIVHFRKLLGDVLGRARRHGGRGCRL